jgi:hypothetical protein
MRALERAPFVMGIRADVVGVVPQRSAISAQRQEKFTKFLYQQTCPLC